MATSPAWFLFCFLSAAIIIWTTFVFASWTVTLLVKLFLNISVRFRFAGPLRLKNVAVQLKKGPVESISVGDIGLSLRDVLFKIGLAFLSRDPKIHLLITDFEVVLRAPAKREPNSRTRKPHSSGSGKGNKKLKLLANVARHFALSVGDLVIKTPNATLEIKDTIVHISRDAKTKSYFFRMFLTSISAYVAEPRGGSDISSNNTDGRSAVADQPGDLTEESSAGSFNCGKLAVCCELGLDGESGIATKDLDISSGGIMMNFNEKILLKKKKSSSRISETTTPSGADQGDARALQKRPGPIPKYIALFPAKASFSLPKLEMRFVCREQELSVENHITGVQLKGLKSQCSEDSDEVTRVDVQLDLSEIHLLKEAETPILELLKVHVASLLSVPAQGVLPARAEIDVRLGGTKCSMILGRLKPWMCLQIMLMKKKMELREENPVREEGHVRNRLKSTSSKSIMWTCTTSAPEMTIILYNMSGLPQFQGCCSQSSQIFANNVSTPGMIVKAEFSELNLNLFDEYQKCTKEGLLGLEVKSGSLLHITRVSLDWGKNDVDAVNEEDRKVGPVLSVDLSGMALYFSMKRMESLIAIAMLVQALIKHFSSMKKKIQSRAARPSQSGDTRPLRSSGKGTRLIKLNVEQCSINFCGDVGLENTVVQDPKRVNYGSQGGRVVISINADGTERTAHVISTVSDECKSMPYSLSLEIFHFTFCLNKDKLHTQIALQRARSMYQEHLEESSPGTKVLLLDLQNAKFVRRSGGRGIREMTTCSLFSATDITLYWEPDLHITLFELAMHLKLQVQHQKLQALEDLNLDSDSSTTESEKVPIPPDHSNEEKKQKKKESIFALDVEMLKISAEAGDGVETTVQVQSIFSENACIGVLLEGILLSFSNCQIVKSSRMQISRIPNSSSGPNGTIWDWVIQGNLYICLPYRLELRAIDDAVEDQLRALKLITTAKSKLILPMKKDVSKSNKKPSAPKFGRLRLIISKLTAEIEEEPLQGWLDEHYQLMKNEAWERAVRLKFLEDLVSNRDSSFPAPDATTDPVHEKITYKGVEIDLQDPSVVDKLREDIYRESFRSYYQACQSLTAAEGSGAWKIEGCQSGFTPSTARTSQLTIIATDLDVTLKLIDGGEAGMVEIVKTLDPVARENNIPFARLYGSNINLQAGTLVAQIRDYTYPIFSATAGKCVGRLVLAQQATAFQPQIYQDVYVGRWRKVRLLRSATGTTPPMKTFADLPLHFQKGEVSYGAGYEPVFTDISYAFTVALRRANLSIRNPGPLIVPPKKEKSLPWWDEMRNYIHGRISLSFLETRWVLQATIDPYEKLDKLEILSSRLEIKQSDGCIYASANHFKLFSCSLETLARKRNVKLPIAKNVPLLEVPFFTIEVRMDWDCDSRTPLNHYLFALPIEGKPREYVFDPFRSTSFSLSFDISFSLLGKSAQPSGVGGSTSTIPYQEDSYPTVNLGAHDLEWFKKFATIMALPPNKIRTFSRWPRYGVPRILRSGNLSLDRVMTEFMLRLDSTPTCIKNMPLDDDDPAKGLTFKMAKLKLELVNSRGRQRYTFDSFREPLDPVYLAVDLHVPKAFIDRVDAPTVAKLVQMTRKNSLRSSSMERGAFQRSSSHTVSTDGPRDDGFLLSSDYLSIRKHSPKVDPARLVAWKEAGRKNLETPSVRSEFDQNGSDSDEHARSDHSDDDGYNVVIADNCQRIFVYGLKLLWNIENRDAVVSWGRALAKAIAPPPPSPSRKYTQRKLAEERQKLQESETSDDGAAKLSSESIDGSSSSQTNVETAGPVSSTSPTKVESSSDGASNTNVKDANDDKEGTRHFMVNVVEPQFNLHSEEANGRFLLAAVSGRILARSFNSVLQVGYEVIEKELGSGPVKNAPECQPQMTWNRMEISVMLEHVQAHVAPTDVDPGAGIQWLPKIRKRSPKVKRTGALLERVFMPCDMYCRFTRHNGGAPDLKVKPLKDLAFNSQDITAMMTSRQFQVLLDVMTSLLLSRPPKPRRSALLYSADDGEDVEEEADAVVPDGVEEVELARISLEVKERDQRLVLHDIYKLSVFCDASGDGAHQEEGAAWMVTGGRSMLVQRLKNELVDVQKARKAASASLRTALQKAAQQRLMEKEKNKSPSCAMRISLQINKVALSMLVDGKAFAEAEIHDMVYDFDRDYKDIGVARFTIKYFVIRDRLPNTKCDTLLAPWNPPSDWGKKVMLRIDAKLGAPRDGSATIELLQVDVYPLKIHLSEAMYRAMWDYLFPEEEQDSQRRQEVWKVSTTAGLKRVKKGSHEGSTSGTKDSSSSVETFYGGKPNSKANAGHLRRTSSFDKTWEENVAESVADELVLQAHSTGLSLVANGKQEKSNKGKSKDPKSNKSGRPAQEEKKLVNEKRSSQPERLKEFRNIKISQVELLITYEASRLPISELRLLMDPFERKEFTGTWRRLIGKIKKHVVIGVVKSLTGMQGKKFKGKGHGQKEIAPTVPDVLELSDSDGELGDKSEMSFLRPPTDGAGDGFVTSVKGLFGNQRKKAKAFVLRTMRGEQDKEYQGEWSEGEADFSPFARQLTITKTKKLIKRHTKKFGSKSQKGGASPSSPTEGGPMFRPSDSSGGSSASEEDHE